VRLWERTLAVLQRLAGVTAEMEPDEAVRRTLLLAASIIYTFAGLLWGALYVALGEPGPGLIPIAYGILTGLNAWLFVTTGRERWFRESQLGLTLLLPFALQLALGGIGPSGWVIVWAFTSPVGALLIGEEEQADRWFAGFVVLLAASIALQPLVRDGNSLSEAARRAFLIANVSAVLTIVFVLLRYFDTLKTRAYAALRTEEQKSERLLLNVLPADIARILKEGNSTIATAHDSVTVLFADMVAFTQLSEILSPVEMVELLNELFTYFDSLVERSGLEKVRTIGDAYMVVGGVPRPRDDHAEAVAVLGLEMLRFREHVDHPHVRSLSFRIGINSGPVVAGVVGTTKFHYDVWGDAVNVASRMESQGVPGRVQVGPGAHPLLDGSFVMEPRGLTDIKGKGQLQTWLLVAASGSDERVGSAHRPGSGRGPATGMGHSIGASTVWPILMDAGIDPAPTRTSG